MPITEGGQFTPDNTLASPGVFFIENNQPSTAAGVENAGAVIVGPFKQGPGFSPTICTSIADLQNQFGVPDGTFYAPYTAQQYLQQKGFVTVCRVGALTGYHQMYPWIIWAENGTWVRNPDAGWLNPTASYVVTSSLVFNTVNQQMVNGSGSYTGSVIFNNQPATITLMPGSVTATSPSTISSSAQVPNSGSTLYDGQSIAGFISGVFSFTGSLNVTTASATSASILNQIFAQNLFAGTVAVEPNSPVFTTSQLPFTSSLLENVYVSQSYGTCNILTLNLFGFLTGSIGIYNGLFNSGSGVFNPCTGQWTLGNTQYKVLAVLTDTEFGGINSNLQAPGFLGSTQLYSGSTVVGQIPTGSDAAPDQFLNFVLALSQSNDGAYGTYAFSLDPNSPQYITNVFGNNPQVGNPTTYVPGTKIEASYLYSIFQDSIAAVAANPTQWRINGTAMPSGSWTGEPLNFTDQWSLNLINGDSIYGLTNALTPVVLSQQIAPWNGGLPHRYPLFQLATLSDGTYTNTSYKIQISNVRLAGTVSGTDWGTFSLSVRDYDDTDQQVNILEQYNNLTLNPEDPNFISRVIGDQYNYIRYDGKLIQIGLYANQSSYIRVVMSTTPYPVTAVPYGFQAYSTPINGALGNFCPPVAYTMASVYGLQPGKYPSGVDFQGPPASADAELTALYPTASLGQTCWEDNEQYNCPVPAGSTIGLNTVFALDAFITASGVFTGSSSTLVGTNAIPAIYNAANEATYVKMRSFVFGFQGGFDGQSPAIAENLGGNIIAGNTQGLNCATSTSPGSVAYNQCIKILSNADQYDINLIVTPGIVYSLHPYVTNLVVNMCQTRGDVFYILDLYEDSGNPTTSQISTVINLASEFNTNYACAYYPWVNILDTNINQIVTVPPSVVMPAVYAASDNASAEWWAPAGLNRGGIPTAVSVTDRTTQHERDLLYTGRVNPIASFPGEGVVVWGQRTLYVPLSPTDPLRSINVRRLLINLKKFFASAEKYLVFEQSTATTWNKFLAIANPYLESVQQRSGLYAFQVVMDSSTNTEDLIDQGIMYGKLYIQPTRTAEMIVMAFEIQPQGSSFPTS